MILVLSDRNDAHANFVINKMNFLKLSYYRFNLDVESLKSTIVSFNNGQWHIIQNEINLKIEDVKCVWNRRTFVELLLDEEYNQTVDFKIWKNEWNKTLLGMYSSLRHRPWLNPWRKAYEAENKYLQMELALKHNLILPKTIVSNNKEALSEFIKEENEVALKLMHQDFYKTEDGIFKGFYVNKINLSDLDNFNDKEENPIVLQQYVHKDFEVRYTVVGDKHFACKIESQKSAISSVDWRRYDIPNTPHFAIKIPGEIKIKVNSLMKELGIEYGALDFIVSYKNWVFLEINSMGQFLWIEDLSGLKISDAIIEWMQEKNI